MLRWLQQGFFLDFPVKVDKLLMFLTEGGESL
jgi:hypothetical protein